MNDIEDTNLADTLARILPKTEIVFPVNPVFGDTLMLAVPENFKVQQFDTEALLPCPKRAIGTATFDDSASFVAYVKRHVATESTVVWCSFNPQNFGLKFTAVLDDHARGYAGWRGHKAVFEPAMSAEWKVWKGANRQVTEQMKFAEFLQEHEEDVSAVEGMPTSLQLASMANDFVCNEERMLKSAVRLQSGGTRLTYVADPDKGTTDAMNLFEKFSIGIPVFHGGDAFRIVVRLKYRLGSGKVSFFYELVRADRVHEFAAKALIARVTEGLGEIPVLMGSM